MNVEKFLLADLEKLSDEKLDCLWVCLADRKAPSPLQGKALQWLDWKLQGQISRFLKDGKHNSKQITFLPTMHKLPVPYIALQPPSAADWDSFAGNCEGMKLSRVLFLCEDDAIVPRLEKEMKQQRFEAFPAWVALATEAEAGG